MWRRSMRATSRARGIDLLHGLAECGLEPSDQTELAGLGSGGGFLAPPGRAHVSDFCCVQFCGRAPEGCNGPLLTRPADAELCHPRLEGARREPQSGGGAVLAVHLPPQAASIAVMCAFSTPRASRSPEAPRRRRERDAQPPAGGDDHRALDDVAQLARIARPGVVAAAPPSTPCRSCRSACRTPRRIRRRIARPAAGCPRDARAGAARGWEHVEPVIEIVAKRPSAMQRVRSLRVAAMIRTSTFIGCALPCG